MSSWSDKEQGPTTSGNRARARYEQLLITRSGHKTVTERDDRGHPRVIRLEPWFGPPEVWVAVENGKNPMFERQ